MLLVFKNQNLLQGKQISLNNFRDLYQRNKIICKNILCPKRINVWRSQPDISGTNISAGNLLLCFAILAAGGSASKVFRVFSHIGLACISLGTFFKHQKESVIYNLG